MLSAFSSGIDEFDSKTVAANFGIPVPRGVRIEQIEELGDQLDDLSAPYVVKILSTIPMHKSDIGGVTVGLANQFEVKDAIRAMQADSRIPHEQVTGFLIEEMAPSGHELIIGGKIDRSFGPVIMVGAGGIYVHVLDDVAVRSCPVDRTDALDMLNELRIAPLLFGARGQDPVAIDDVVDAILRIGGESGLLVTHSEEVAELDVNPLITGPHHVCAADVRVVLSEGANS